MNSLYVVAAWVPRRETIVVGALGPITFARALVRLRGERATRAGRPRRAPQRAAKPLRWHADYLFARHPATRAWLIDTELTECELAARLRAALQGAEPRKGRAERVAAAAQPAVDDVTDRVTAIAGFGASDCGCPRPSRRGRPVRPTSTRLLRALPRRRGQGDPGARRVRTGRGGEALRGPRRPAPSRAQGGMRRYFTVR